MVVKSMNLKDWKNTPLYMHWIEGETELEAILQCCPEFEIIRLANFSRDDDAPFNYGNRVLLDLTLKRQCDLTEIEYELSVLKKRDFTIESLLVLYTKAKITLMA